MPGSHITINGRFLLQAVTGVQRVAREILGELDRMAAANEIPPPRVLLPKAGKITGSLDLQKIRPERIGRWSGHAWEQLDLPRECGAEPLLCLGNTAPVSRLHRKGEPVVTMVHDLSYAYFPEAYSWQFRAVYRALLPQVARYSERVVTVSKAEMKSIARHFPALADSGRLSFFPNGGVRDAAMRTALADANRGPERRNYGLYVGSLTRRKNAEGILRAAVDFLRRYPKMRFVVIGSTGASFQSVTSDVSVDVANRLEFHGQVDDTNEIYAAYRNARFLLFPSFYESSGLPPIEAMTFGCPVVSSRIPALLERCGNAAVYCAADDQGSIAAAIDVLMRDDVSWREQSEAARSRAATFSWNAQARGLLDLCEMAR